MALKAQMLQMAVVVNSLTSSSISSRSQSTNLPLGSLAKSRLKCRRQRAGVARASGMAEPESAGTDLVDSNMMVLRKRIQSIRIQETVYDTPADWADWERSAYSSYRADICLLLSTMQSQLLTLRPGIVLSLVSVLMSVLLVMSILFASAVGTQLWSVHLALLELGAPLHQ